ncbi:hypothetical protein [Halobellus ruber]|uniref:Uncharacterized protein n=1 Tax=Halobellus ruber TaxID=2761102 RepID=A0A7J9SNH6_9EURY|nr:hypothetical protein [Halobellus ruber]MBB6647746.1 hypothetical protein [Halobellus ruber]
MSDDTPEGPDDNQVTSKRIGRLQGIRGHVEDFVSKDYSYLDLPGLYDVDPEAQSPYVVSGTFIPEEVGGNVTVVNADGESDGNLGQENLNQMLSSFLPGGYKQRWGNFDLWRGAWDHETRFGHADIGPMFEWADSFPLTELIGSVSEVDYAELPFDPEGVRVYVPLTVRVTMEDKNDTDYVWIEDKGIVWTGDPPMRYEPLSSDPTTNYLWFKHVEGSLESDTTPVADADIVNGFSFDDDRRFIRCYYASLLTLYPEDSQRTRSEIIRYRCEEDERDAFVASRERSQLLSFELDRDSLRSNIKRAIDSNPYLKRDLRIAFLQTKIWEELFFEQNALESVFAIEPLVEHLLGIDYWRRVVDNEPMGVFSLSGTGVIDEVQRLLPEDSSRHLRLLGYEGREASRALDAIENHYDPVAKILAECRNETLLLNFAERILVHSAEHALSTWSNDLTGSGTTFELWYDVTFQESDDDVARIAVYDPIQGGAGIAKEVYEQVRENPSVGIEAGLAAQGRCHSAASDRATIELLGSHPSGTLYDIYHNDHDEFTSLAESKLSGVVGDFEHYSKEDLLSRVEQRTRILFETRELAAFYSYVATEYMSVKETIERTPRVVDLALHLNRHVFTDPRIKTTYERFADDSGRRDIAELGERLGELTVQCVTACPDCLKTDSTICLHGTGQQAARLNRRLLTAVLDQ